MKHLSPKNVAKLLCFVLVIALTCSSCSADKSKCKKLFKTLETSCHNCDIPGMINCLKPSYAKPLNTAYSVASTIFKTTGEGISFVLNLITEYAGFDDLNDTEAPKDSAWETMMKSVDIKTTEFNLEETTGTVTCEITYMSGETKKETILYFGVEKIEEKWYISSFSRQKKN